MRAALRRLSAGFAPFRRELLGAALLAAVIVALTRWAPGRLPVAAQAALGLVMPVTAAAVLWRPAAALVGPVFLHDLVRTTRRSRIFLTRTGFALLLLAVLFLLYASWFGEHGGLAALLTSRRLSPEALPKFAESFFLTFMGVQYGLVLLLTPGSTATAVAEEKERRTLEFLLTSELTDREIIAGKLAARVANLVLFVMTGLPILGVLPFLGGVDPKLVLLGYAATLLTLCSLGSLGILNSVLLSRPRGAVFLTHVEALLYLLFTSTCCLPVTPTGAATPLNWLSGGNLLVAFAQVSSGTFSPLNVLLDQAIFHGTVTTLCCVTAWRKLRPWTWREPAAIPKGDLDQLIARRAQLEPVTPEESPLRQRPPVDERPLLWKELYVESGPLLQTTESIATITGGVVLLYSLVIALLTFMVEATRNSGGHDLFVNGLVRILGTSLSCVVFLSIALRAARSISGERERGTLDSLLLTPVESRAILAAKWQASMLCTGGLWWGIFPVWLLGALAGGLSWLALPLLVVAWLTYASVAANLGLWFSLVSRTTFRATAWTLLALAGVMAAPHLVWSCVDAVVALAGRRGLRDVGAYQLMPPVSLYQLAFHEGDVMGMGIGGAKFQATLPTLLLGLAGYALFAALLWTLLRLRFGPVTGRVSPVSRASVIPQPGERTRDQSPADA